MPNHIKNRIEILGTKKQVKNVVDKFSTSFPEILNRTHDNSMIICKDLDGVFVGWYDDTKDEFEYVSKRDEKIKGLPAGIEYEYNKAFVQFPDFNKVIPMPESLQINIHGEIEDAVKNALKIEVSKNPLLGMLESENRGRTKSPLKFNGTEWEQFITCLNNVKKYGAIYWYDWCIANWGTKWNSYSCEKEADNIFLFETAWSGVPNLIELISKEFPEVTFLYEYSDEDTGCNCGTGKYLNGEIEFRNLVNESKDAYDLAFKLRPDRAENYKLVNGKYQYVED